LINNGRYTKRSVFVNQILRARPSYALYKNAAFDSRGIHAIMKQSLPADVDGGRVGWPSKSTFTTRFPSVVTIAASTIPILTDRLMKNPNLKVPAQFSLTRITVWIT